MVCRGEGRTAICPFAWLFTGSFGFPFALAPILSSEVSMCDKKLVQDDSNDSKREQFPWLAVLYVPVQRIEYKVCVLEFVRSGQYDLD